MKQSLVGAIILLLSLFLIATNVVLILLSPPSTSVDSLVTSPHLLVTVGKQEAPEKVPNTTTVSVWDILQQAGVPVAELREHSQELPSMETIVEAYGSKPVIVGLESCAVFRRNVPEERRMLGAAGMFSTGTNLVTQLLKHNCYIPARQRKYGSDATKEELGMRWQVRKLLSRDSVGTQILLLTLTTLWIVAFGSMGQTHTSSLQVAPRD